MKKHLHLVALLVAPFLLLDDLRSMSSAAPPPIQAYGYVTGRLHMIYGVGGWCRPSHQNCNGALYTDAHFNQSWPLVRMKVYVINTSVSPEYVMGIGETDHTGTYKIAWQGYGGGSFIIRYYYEHRDNTFTVNTSSGGRWSSYCSQSVAIQHGTTSSKPQRIKDCTIGSVASPHSQSNTYAHAERTWFAFQHSNNLRTSISNIKIRMDAGNDCSSSGSCARASESAILLGVDAWRNGHTLSHEFGHIASHRASQGYIIGHLAAIGDDSTGLPSDRDGAGWHNTSAEYRGTAAHEAIATALGQTGNWLATAADPIHCNSSSTCTPSSNNRMEHELTACTDYSPEAHGRRHRDIVRYFWDLYDSNIDTCGGVSERIGGGVWQLADMLLAFPGGRNGGEKNEHWSCANFIFSICWPDDADQRNTQDFKQNFQRMSGVDTTALLNCNCAH